jgi:hypothetical protein
MMELIHQRQQRLDDLTHRMELAQRQLLEQALRRWERISAAVRHYDLRLVLSGVRKELAGGTAALVAVMRNVLLQHRVRSERLQTALESLSPLAILDRGYALVFDSEGKLLKDARTVERRRRNFRPPRPRRNPRRSNEEKSMKHAVWGGVCSEAVVGKVCVGTGAFARPAKRSDARRYHGCGPSPSRRQHRNSLHYNGFTA